MTDVEPTLDVSLQLPAILTGIKISDEERELTSQAHIEFESQNYDKCVEALDKLAEVRQSDYKVLHNKAVAQFYLADLTKTDEFYKNLQTIKKQTENQTADESDDIDMAYLLYNESVVCYNLRQYNMAVCTLNKLFNVIEPLDENLAVKVCMLLAEIYLIMYKPDKAGVVLNYVENLIQGNNKAIDQVPQQTQDSSTRSSKDVDDVLKGKLHQFRARQNLLTKSMKACKREIKEVMNSNALSNLFFLKSNFELLRQNHKKSIKLLNIAPKTESNGLETGECLSTMYFNNLGCVHFQMHKYNLAAFYSRLALEEGDKAMSKLPQTEKNDAVHSYPLVGLRLSRRHEILYNLGIQLLFSGRPKAAFDCLVESIQTYHTNARLWLRLAESCVLAHQMASDKRWKCNNKFNVVKSIIGSGSHRKIVLLSEKQRRILDANNESQSAAMPACTLEFSSICLQNALLLLKAGESLLESRQDNDAVQNHIGEDNDSILEMNGSIDSDPLHSSGSVETSIPALPGPPIKLKEISNIRCAMLCCSAYVSLGLGDNVSALEHAQRLLEHTDISGVHKFLGHLYAAESLIKLNRIDEAIPHLSGDNISDINIGPVGDTSGGCSEKGDKERESRTHCCEKSSSPQSNSEAKATLLYNLASTYCLRNEYDKAKKCLSQACLLDSSRSLSARMVMLAVYIELQNGSTSSALQIIKKNQFLQIFSNGKSKQAKRLSDYWKS